MLFQLSWATVLVIRPMSRSSMVEPLALGALFPRPGGTAPGAEAKLLPRPLPWLDAGVPGGKPCDGMTGVGDWNPIPDWLEMCRIRASCMLLTECVAWFSTGMTRSATGCTICFILPLAWLGVVIEM